MLIEGDPRQIGKKGLESALTYTMKDWNNPDILHTSQDLVSYMMSVIARNFGCRRVRVIQTTGKYMM